MTDTTLRSWVMEIFHSRFRDLDVVNHQCLSPSQSDYCHVMDCRPGIIKVNYKLKRNRNKID